jgi:carotenoid cleavage dioxygenase-like enzyme
VKKGPGGLFAVEKKTEHVPPSAIVRADVDSTASRDSGVIRKGPQHLFLIGNFRPVQDEIDRHDLAIEGVWPESLRGTIVQAGPNPAHTPGANYHPFDGSGMLHAVRIDGNGASYRNRYVETPDHVRERAAQRSLVPSILEPPPLEILESGRFPYRDAPNAVLIPHGQAAYALGGFHAPIQVDPRTLETLGRDQILGEDDAPFGGHPKRDPETGELFYFRCHVGPEPRLVLGAVDRHGRRCFEAAVGLKTPRLMHDFAVARRHAVFFDTGVSFDASRARSGHSGWSFDRSIPSRLLVVPREGGAVREFAIEPCVVIHTLNAWESMDGRFLTVLAIRYPSLPEALSFDGSLSAGPPHANDGRLCEWTMDLRTGDVSMRTLSDTPAEFPRQDESLLMQPARRAWLTANLPIGALIEVDLAEGRERHLPHGRGRYGSEFVFVAGPEGQPECGFLIGFVWDAGTGRSEVVAIDTTRAEAGPIARILLPCRVPFGFHANWFPDAVEQATA